MMGFLKRLFGGETDSSPAGATGPVVRLTPVAAAEMKQVLAPQDLAPGWALRVSIQMTPDAMGGFRYDMDAVEEAPRPGDAVFESEGIRIFVDPNSAKYLVGTVIDLKQSPEGKGFVFNNPNVTKAK